MDPSKNIFWGLVVKPGKRYETEVQEPFRITKACLEPATAGGKVSSVFVECDNNEEFIIANLNAKTFNETIDLSFNEGEKICFKVDGPGTVHLTGNLLDDPPPDMLPGGEWSEEESGESEEEDTIEAGKKIQEVSEKEAVKILKRKKEQVGDVKPKKAKVEEMDTTADTSVGDLDDTDNFAEENDSESDDDEDSDADSDSDEENTTVGDVTTDMADTTAASDDDDDSSDEESDEEESKPEPVKVATPVKKVEEVKANGDVKTPKDKKKGAVENTETPKTKDKVKESKTPKLEAEPKKEAKTPKQEAKTPKSEAKTPKQDTKASKEGTKTPKQEAKTPKQDDKAAKEDGKTPKQDAKTPKQDGKTPKDAQTPGKTPKRTLKGGVQAEDLKEGTGPECKPGNMVGMYYEGRLKSNNKKFDGLQSGKPFKFKLGSGQVIKGWDVGVLGMKVGGKRRLTIPPALGYGGQGAPPDIPPNATLVFDIECKLVK